MEHFTFVDGNDDADLVRNNETGGYCWHQYDGAGDPGKFSIDYSTIKAAKAAWPNVEWEQ